MSFLDHFKQKSPNLKSWSEKGANFEEFGGIFLSEKISRQRRKKRRSLQLSAKRDDLSSLRWPLGWPFLIFAQSLFFPEMSFKTSSPSRFTKEAEIGEKTEKKICSNVFHGKKLFRCSISHFVSSGLGMWDKQKETFFRSFKKLLRNAKVF